jgi:hypothetical protein
VPPPAAGPPVCGSVPADEMKTALPAPTCGGHLGEKTVAVMSDRELVERVRRGDCEAMMALVQRHHSSVFYRAYRLTGSPKRAQEITSDVFIAFQNGLPPGERVILRRWLLSLTERLVREAG